MGVTLESLGGWPAVLGRLFAREDLSAPEAEAVLDVILLGEATPAQIAAFAAALRTKGETAEEMIGAVRSMRAHSERIELGTGLVDTCGTGGDRSGSINVSSMAAVVVAAAGARVCKHGGRAASSMAGSADVFEALGVAIELGPVGVARCVEETGIGFCFAPRFHPAMRFAAPVRRELGVATLFNFLGPLANPAAASRQLVGVGDSSMAERVLSVLEANSAEHAMVVFGHDGLDELSTVAPSTLLETVRRSDGSYERSTAEVNATDFGIAPASAEELRGGSPETNARLVRAVFSGEVGPRREFVALNAGAALKVAGLTGSLADGIELARATLDDGRAARTLAGLVAASQRAAGEAPARR